VAHEAIIAETAKAQLIGSAKAILPMRYRNQNECADWKIDFVLIVDYPTTFAKIVSKLSIRTLLRHPCLCTPTTPKKLLIITCRRKLLVFGIEIRVLIAEEAFTETE
jgi:hypothetical protein